MEFGLRDDSEVGVAQVEERRSVGAVERIFGEGARQRFLVEDGLVAAHEAEVSRLDQLSSSNSNSSNNTITIRIMNRKKEKKERK